MATADQTRWDERYAQIAGAVTPGLPDHFEPYAETFANVESAIDVACGSGRASVWLALQGVAVTGYDISPVAIAQATALASTHSVSHLCRFEVADFDNGLPNGPLVDLAFCNMFRNANLDQPMTHRLNTTGLLAIAALSEVDASPGRFRIKPGELLDAFAAMKQLGSGEGDGIAWLVAHKRTHKPTKQASCPS